MPRPSALSRRFLLQAAAFTSLGALPSPADAATPERKTLSELKVLWNQRTRLILETESLDKRWLAARSRLPSWCLPGPKFRGPDGVEARPIVGWPESRTAISLSDDRYLLRPSPADLRELFYQDADDVSLEVAKTNYRARSRVLLLRLRERRKVLTEIGLPRSSDWKVVEDKIDTLEKTIFALAPDPDVAAAQVLIACRNHRLKSATSEVSVQSDLKQITHADLCALTPNLNDFILGKCL